MSHSDSSEVLDEVAARAATEGDTELLSELAGLFLEESPRLRAQVRRAVDAGDANALECAAHTLKGCAASVHGRRTARAADALLRMARLGDLSEAKAGCDALEEELEALERALSGLVPCRR